MHDKSGNGPSQESELPGAKYEGYVVYSGYNHPIGVISSNGEKAATCSLRTIPKKFATYLTAIEDKRFFRHPGIDVRGIARAVYKNITAGRIVQGGSTLTQQLARNILRDNRISLIRKTKEILLTIKLESKYSKETILESYCNRVFWGRNIYGLRAASLVYFSKEPERLATAEQIALITLLRGPNYYLKNNEKLNNRYHQLNNLLRERNVLDAKRYAKSKKANYSIKSNNLQIFGNNSANCIANRIDQTAHTIFTSIDLDIQREAVRYVSESSYPTSLIGISKAGIIAVASSYGTDYPFSFRSNVGSTLKPLIYTCIRDNGFKDDELISTECSGEYDWDVREVQSSVKDFITIKEALKLSNNNAFLNASYKVGVAKIMSFLARTLNQPEEYIVPASILGATVNGITLYELVSAYYRHFIINSQRPSHNECIGILRDIAKEKLMLSKDDVFLKTGTTNKNRERFGIVGKANLLLGFLRQGNEQNDYSKDGSFIGSIMAFLKKISKKAYSWG